MKGSDAFERSLRQSLDGFEVPFNSADWTQMEQALDGQRPGTWWTSPILYAAVLAGAVATAGAYFLLTDDGGGSSITEGANSEQLMTPSMGSDVEGAMGTEAQDGDPSAATLESVGAVQDEVGIIDPATTALSGASGTNTGPKGSSERAPNGAGPVSPAQKGTGNEAPESHADLQPVAGSTGAFKASVSRGCEGAAVEFSVNNMPEDGIYLWNFGDGSFSNKPNPSHIYNKPGRFTVTLSMSRAGAGTITNEPYADLIVIDEVPEARFDHVFREYAGHVPSMHFENRSHGGTSYHWDFGDGTTSEIAHPDHVYREKGLYKVVLTVMNSAGCEDVIEKDVRVDSDYNLLAPASFSPNGDGDDDLFMPQALKDLGVKFQLSIYEPRSGRLVYQTGDATKPWTGRSMNSGAMCSPGEYVWMVEIKEGLHLGEITYEGKVSLVN
jgi:hypothetical protein